MRPLLFSAALALAPALLPATPALAGGLETAPVQAAGADAFYVSDGVVEAVRQSVLGAQVAGRITDLRVKAGDPVKPGQVLARIDERAAAQQVAASEAQVRAAQAQLEAAQREYARSERLYSKKYISQAAMDQAEAQFKATQAQVRSLVAQAGLASTQTSFHVIQAPYAGVIAEVSVELGDMATPGKPLLRMYDPSALRVVADIPESAARTLTPGKTARIELPAAPEALHSIDAASITVLPTADPNSHTVQVRLALAPRISGLTPGLFARVHLPVVPSAEGRLTIPAQAVITRTELNAVYVVDSAGNAQLRQVRLGRAAGGRVEVLAGLAAGERVALDPVAAARIRP